MGLVIVFLLIIGCYFAGESTWKVVVSLIALGI